MEKGILYVVSTPIGNLQDISFRAIEVLKRVKLVLSEDTRETAKLFREFAIATPQISYRDQNHTRVVTEILNLLEGGSDLALVSDSGTPVLSDPGFKLINDVLAKGIKVKTVPGPSSITAALSISGLPTDKFVFLGFLPKAHGPQTKVIASYGQLDCTLIFFESPYRIVKLLTTIQETLGNRYCAVTAELTKTYERIYRGPISEVLATISSQTVRGEFVVMIAKEKYNL